MATVLSVRPSVQDECIWRHTIEILLRASTEHKVQRASVTNCTVFVREKSAAEQNHRHQKRFDDHGISVLSIVFI